MRGVEEGGMWGVDGAMGVWAGVAGVMRVDVTAGMLEDVRWVVRVCGVLVAAAGLVIPSAPGAPTVTTGITPVARFAPPTHPVRPRIPVIAATQLPIPKPSPIQLAMPGAYSVPPPMTEWTAPRVMSTAAAAAAVACAYGSGGRICTGAGYGFTRASCRGWGSDPTRSDPERRAPITEVRGGSAPPYD